MRKFLRGLILSALFVSTACSLKSKEGESIKIRLEPSAAAMAKKFSLASLFSPVASTVDGIEDLTCFGVNARGGSIPTESRCLGHLQLGEFDGPFSDLSSTFELFLPQEDGQIFEAFGARGGCSEDDEDFSDDETIFKLGTVVANTVTTKSISIPVAFIPSNGFSCETEPFEVFVDSFDYTEADVDSTVNWETGGSCGGNLPMISGDRVNAAIISGNQCVVSTFTMDFSHPYTNVSARVFADTNVTDAGPDPTVMLGVAEGPGAGAMGLGCKFAYPTNNVPTDLVLTVGTFAANLNPSGSTSTTQVLSGLGGTGDFTFSCELQRTTSGTYDVRARVFENTTGALLTEFSSNFSYSPADNADQVFFRIDGGASSFLGTNAFLDDFILKQSDFRQF